MKRLTALVASLFMLTGGLGLVVAPSASAEGGDAWFQSNATPTWETWVPIAYGDGKFVSLSSGSNATTFSPDGKNWYTGELQQLLICASPQRSPTVAVVSSP